MPINGCIMYILFLFIYICLLEKIVINTIHRSCVFGDILCAYIH